MTFVNFLISTSESEKRRKEPFYYAQGGGRVSSHSYPQERVLGGCEPRTAEGRTQVEGKKVGGQKKKENNAVPSFSGGGFCSTHCVTN